jgi:hypothetical protein
MHRAPHVPVAAQRALEEGAMAEVYTGTVLIPGDQIDAYLTAVQAVGCGNPDQAASR